MSLASPDFSNTVIRRFEVSRLIARGGMGEVYLAKDTVLGRDLALKVLRQDVIRDQDRLERFVQEARAASALNHPHVVSVYDIGESAPKQDGVAVGPPVLYIAMEFVVGETLRDAITARHLKLGASLEYLAQVADALDAAHAAGVVHRDLKPENLMIAVGGYAKVLDFGVAKLREDLPRAERPDVPSDSSITTGGFLLGTVGYMSPEQAMGRPVDRRTDVFSFGCVLYEVVSGTRAFSGPSPVATLQQVIDQDPPSLSQSTPNLPALLHAIIARCLAKDPDRRYQTMREIAADLRQVRQDLTSTAAVPALAPARPRRSALAVAAAVALLATGIGLWWSGRRPAVGDAAPNVTINRLTASGTVIDAAIAPDGSNLVWVESVGGLQGLRLRPVGADSSIELVAPEQVGFWGIAFSRDSSRVYYAIKSAREPGGRLFTVDIKSHERRPLLDGIDSTVTMSPDGRSLAFFRAGYPERGATALMVTNADGGEQRVLVQTRAPEFFVPAFFAAPSWSPDGARIALSVHQEDTGEAQIATVDVASGAVERFAERYVDATFTSWLPDGSAILFVANQRDAAREVVRKVWLQPYPRGRARRVTTDLLEYRNISMRADGDAFVAVGLDAVYTLWRVPLDGRDSQRIASERYDGLLGVAPLPDGRIVVSSGERGNPQLAVLDATGSSRTVLTREGTNQWPAASPDGRTIAFVSNRDGQSGIWRMNVDGSNPRLLAHLPRPSWLSITPDGLAVICASLAGTEVAAVRIPLEGGGPTVVAQGLDRPAISPDGRLLAGISVAAAGGSLALIVVPIDGSAPTRILGPIAPATGNGILDWTADGEGILFSTVERANVWLQRLSGGAPVKITSLTDLGIARGRRTPDGRNLIMTRGVAQTDAYLVSNFR